MLKTKDKKIYLLLVIIMFIFTGCQNPLSSSSNKSSQTSNSQNAASNTVNTNSNSSLSSTGTNYTVTTGAVVNPGNAGNVIKSSLIFQSGNFLYCSNWYDGDKIYKMNLNGTGIQKVSDDAASELIVSNNIIYYANESDHNALYYMNIDGTGRKKLLGEPVRNLELLGSLIYYVDSGNTITTFNISNNTKVSLNIKSTYFDSDGNNIYYEDYLSKYALSSIKADGSGFIKLKDDAPTSIVSGSGVVYYSNGWDSNKIYKVSSDGSNRTQLNNFRSSNLVLDNGWIYYINGSDLDKIYKIKIDGTGNTVVSSETFVTYFTVAGNYVFFKSNTDANHSIHITNK